MDDPAHFRMSFGMMLASPRREDRLYGPPGASALGRLDMVVEASYAVIRRSKSDSVQSGPYARLTPRTTAYYP